MSSIIRFEVISGAYNDSPLCYLLQIDEFKFLLDCGWDENFSLDIVEEYKKHIRGVDAVLISHPDLRHMGALPYLVGKCGLSCPIYATVPVYKMGQMFMYDVFLSRSNTEDFDLFSLDDIDAAFDKMTHLKYSQTVHLKGNGQGLQITPLPAGHLIGGAIWRILKEGEEEIIYAVDYNHHKERHLNGCILDTVSKPTIFITDSFNFSYNQSKRRLRDEKLLENILKTLRNDGNVLICTDTAGRVLEIAHFLDQLWKNENSGLFSYTIALLNHVSISVIEFAKSQVEWMNDKIVQSFEVGRYNPFDFKHIKLCRSISELNRLNTPSKNKLVLASTPDLECGFSRQLFTEWCENPKNTIIFTSRSSANTLAHDLILNPNKSDLVLNIKKKVRLEGQELEDYYIEQRERELEKEEQLKKSKELESIDIDESSSSEEEEEDEVPEPASLVVANGANPTTPIDNKHDLLRMNSAKKRFFKHSKKTFPMFPFKEKLIKWDDYGEIIRMEDYCLATDAKNADNKVYDEDGNVLAEVPAVEAAVPEKLDIPMKTVVDTVHLNIKAKLIFIDFEGLSDGDSVKKILANIKPRNLIIVHGDEKPTKDMKDYCDKQQIVPSDRIFAPRIGETVDATLDTQLYHIKLKDELVSSLNFQKVREYELAWIDGIIKPRNISNELNEMTHMSASLDSGFVLQPLTKERNKQHKAIFVNEPKLSDLKLIFIQRMIQAEFSGGVLVCNGKIALKKNESGKIILEGVLSDDYFKVREILYEQYAII